MDNDESLHFPQPQPPFSHGVQFQLPQFMYSGVPMLAPGGGAEVLPAGILSQASWLQKYTSDEPHAFLQSRTTDLHAYPNDEAIQQSRLASLASTSAPFDFEEYTNSTTSNHAADCRSAPLPQFNSDLSTFLSTSGILANPPPLLNQQHSWQYQLQQHNLPSAPSPCGLPVYSASGFDVLSILARVATRPCPHVVLGPVDLTCSFVVVDVRRYDHPIVYCSPTFCALTGYEEHEVLGRNCRFLQAPGGLVQKGEERRFTNDVAVAHLRKSLVAHKECQASIINYKKDNQAFVNLVTVIPIFEGDGDGQREVIYHVGFQVDLTRQPGVILEKVRDGSYTVDYASHGPTPMLQALSPLYPSTDAPGLGQRGEHRKTTTAIPPPVISKDLKKLLADPAFVRSFPITTCTTVPLPLPSSSSALPLEDTQLGSNSLLSLILLESMPDFILVVSLQGTFLYVAPSVRRVLGYEPSDLVGGSICDYTHPEDVVPLKRELKESSASGVTSSSSTTIAGGGMVTDATTGGGLVGHVAPRTVDLLFRARTKAGVYVWIECRGRLHVEPGKGRKAIILSGRAKEMTKLSWGDMVRWGGGVSKKSLLPLNGEATNESEQTREFWGMMHGESFSVHGMTFLSAAADVKHILGWTAAEMVGMTLGGVLVGDEIERVEQEIGAGGIGLSGLSSRYQQQYGHQEYEHSDTIKAINVQCKMKRKDDTPVQVEFIVYRSPRDPLVNTLTATTTKNTISPSPLVYCIKRIDPSYLQSSSSSAAPSSSSDLSLVHPLADNIFQDLETSRNSSWQYELQQLRFANQRLEEEIKTLEATITVQDRGKAAEKNQNQARQSSSSKKYHQSGQQERRLQDYTTMRPLYAHPPLASNQRSPTDFGHSSGFPLSRQQQSSSHLHPHAVSQLDMQTPISTTSSNGLEWSMSNDGPPLSTPVPLYLPNSGQSRQAEHTTRGLRTTGTGAQKRSWGSLAQ